MSSELFGSCVSLTNFGQQLAPGSRCAPMGTQSCHYLGNLVLFCTGTWLAIFDRSGMSRCRSKPTTSTVNRVGVKSRVLWPKLIHVQTYKQHCCLPLLSAVLPPSNHHSPGVRGVRHNPPSAHFHSTPCSHDTIPRLGNRFPHLSRASLGTIQPTTDNQPRHAQAPKPRHAMPCHAILICGALPLAWI